jgi:hypothetical protein
VDYPTPEPPARHTSPAHAAQGAQGGTGAAVPCAPWADGGIRKGRAGGARGCCLVKPIAIKLEFQAFGIVTDDTHVIILETLCAFRVN